LERQVEPRLLGKPIRRLKRHQLGVIVANSCGKRSNQERLRATIVAVGKQLKDLFNLKLFDVMAQKARAASVKIGQGSPKRNVRSGCVQCVKKRALHGDRLSQSVTDRPPKGFRSYDQGRAAAHP